MEGVHEERKECVGTCYEVRGQIEARGTAKKEGRTEVELVP